MRRVVEQVLVGANHQSVHYRLHPRNSARHHDSLMRFLVRIDPSRQLDDSIFHGPDIHSALAQYRIISECFEDSFLELLGTVQGRFRGIEIVVEIRIEFILVESFVIELLFFTSSAAESILDPVGQSLEPSESFPISTPAAQPAAAPMAT